MTEKTSLLLMAEFGTTETLWLRNPDGKASRAIPLDRLPLSEPLKQRMRAWALRHDELNDPPFSWGTRHDLEVLADEGRFLLAQVRLELGDGYDVDGRTRR